MPHDPVVNEVFSTNYRFEGGYLTIDDRPGIGVEIDEEQAKRYPYQMASLPVARKQHGTIFHW